MFRNILHSLSFFHGKPTVTYFLQFSKTSKDITVLNTIMSTIQQIELKSLFRASVLTLFRFVEISSLNVEVEFMLYCAKYGNVYKMTC